MSQSSTPLVGVIMGSKSDWPTMQHTSELLEQFGVEHECCVVSAHRTPDWLAEYSSTRTTDKLESLLNKKSSGQDQHNIDVLDRRRIR